jgi:hypothetical protein
MTNQEDDRSERWNPQDRDYPIKNKRSKQDPYKSAQGTVLIFASRSRGAARVGEEVRRNSSHAGQIRVVLIYTSERCKPRGF